MAAIEITHAQDPDVLRCLPSRLSRVISQRAWPSARPCRGVSPPAREAVSVGPCPTISATPRWNAACNPAPAGRGQGHGGAARTCRRSSLSCAARA